MIDDKKLKGKTVLITGATGFIGSYLVLYLAKFNCKVIALTTNKNKAQKLFKNLSYVSILQQDIQAPLIYNGEVSYIIHAASITDSKTFITEPIKTIDVNLFGTKNLLEFAYDKKVDNFLYISSIEVYGIKSFGADVITEENYGYMDILTARSSYAQSKKMCETMCIAYASEKNMPVNIARISQVFGGVIQENDNRMFAQFIKAAVYKNDIVLHTKGETVRTYCYLPDAVCGLTTILLHGESGHAYNVCNDDMTLSVKNLAEYLANLFSLNVKFEISENQNAGYLPTLIMPTTSKKLQNLGWRPSYTLETAIKETVANYNKEV